MRRASLLICCALLVWPSVAQAQEIDPEEYAVYAAVIEALYLREGIEQIVITDRTVWGFGLEEGLGGQLQGMRQVIPEVEDATLEDFQAKNAATHSLRNHFHLPVSVVLVSEHELQKLFEEARGWELFYARYPQSQGTMTLSRVGFNRQQTQAFVYVGNQSQMLAGAGYYVLLIKRDGVWAVHQKHMAWIS